LKKETIKTSEKDWLKKLTEFYKKRTSFTIIDDASLGINPLNQTILEMSREAGLSIKDWLGVLVALGISTFGSYMVVAAIMDPEPTSKLELMIASGAILIFTSGMTAIRILTKVKPPKITVTQFGFEVEWE